jgi:hypothetical protein
MRESFSQSVFGGEETSDEDLMGRTGCSFYTAYEKHCREEAAIQDTLG